MNQFAFNLPTRIVFGAGVFKEVGAIAAGLGKKALLVTGSKAMKALGHTDRLVAVLRQAGVESELYDKIEANPSNVTIDAGAVRYNETRCDMLVALGGGSALDAAKAIGVVARYGGDARDYVGENKIPGPIAPIVAVPTTAGTGSEVTEYAVVSDPRKKVKDAIASFHIYPTVAVVDPELMLKVPPSVTAGTGLDALAQAIEAYTSKLSQPISDAVAVEAVRLCARSLVQVVKHPDDLKAREEMALASTLAGVAISHGDTTVAHVIGEAVGAVCGTDHGITIGILLPHVVAFNFQSRKEKYETIHSILKTANRDLFGTVGGGLDEAIKHLMREMGTPTTLKELGVTAAHTRAILALAKREGLTATNPRNVNEGDLEQLLKAGLG